MTRRTLTYADEPTQSIDVVLASTPTSRRMIKRSLTRVGAVPESSSASAFPPPEASLNVEAQDQACEDDFSILRLDLNLGATRHAKSIINHLEKSSISSLLDNRLAASLDHLALLRKRIYDAHSRVLVTGDLNAGKSTLVNALLRRDEVMPTDEQPLTTRFVEVVSAKENDDVEEIHVLSPGTKYDRSDKNTFGVVAVNKLSEMVADAETDASSAPLRVFLKEAGSAISNPSILHNGVVDISLIDAPGLNRDSIKTTANFARQEEIDVVVFVVSAANHFTLSAKEFIWQAGHEKAHLFIVVNRFDQIKDKERCRRVVLDQIRQLSPKTYEDAADLVHFVDSAKVALGFSDDDDVADDIDEAFSHLEHSLRSFVLVNRSKSKLGPAQNYITRLLADVELLASANTIVATHERDVARDELARVKPVLDRMKKGREGLNDGLILAEEAAVDSASSRSKQAMERGLERVARGELAVPLPGLVMPTYPGLIGLWDYAHEIRKVMLASLDSAVSLAEDDARRVAGEGVDAVIALGNTNLPEDVEPYQRVFVPANMFTARKLSRRTSSVTSLGLGLVNQAALTDVNISDIVDLHHYLFLARPHLPSMVSSTDLVPYAAEVSSFGAASLALGAYSMINGKTVGIRSLIESAIRLCDFASSPVARKWAGPVVGALALGSVAYVVYELPRSVPRNVGRHLQETLSFSSCMGGDADLVPFADAVSGRVSKEVRNVMRAITRDLQDLYGKAVETRANVVKQSQEAERKASAALGHFATIDKKVQDIRETMADIKI